MQPLLGREVLGHLLADRRGYHGVGEGGVLDLVGSEPRLGLGRQGPARLVQLQPVQAAGVHEGADEPVGALGHRGELGAGPGRLLGFGERALGGAKGKQLEEDLAVQGRPVHRLGEGGHGFLEGGFGAGVGLGCRGGLGGLGREVAVSGIAGRGRVSGFHGSVLSS